MLANAAIGIKFFFTALAEPGYVRAFAATIEEATGSQHTALVVLGGPAHQRALPTVNVACEEVLD